jgi:N-acetylglucosaminyldiphosphoundecaprenol N-acetyl-beta-D-mannosaminyltransferase
MSRQTVPYTRILGIPVSAIDLPTAVDTIEGWVKRRERQFVCVREVNGLIEAQKDAELRRLHEDAGLVTPDGMPLVWLSRMRGRHHVKRVCGRDLMLAVCESSVANGYSHFLYGGTPTVMELLKRNLLARFPGLRIAGDYCPPFRPLTEQEDAEVIRSINESGAHYVWVGIGTPKQEFWMRDHVGKLGASAIFGVGAAFDFHAGVKKSAPEWMQRNGLEWFFRLITEPRRLWKRYLINNSRFLALITLELLGLRRNGSP